MARDVHTPGYYLHLEPGNVFCGAGIWHPEPVTLNRIRDSIVKNPRLWRRYIEDPAMCERWELRGDTLSRPPRGYDPAHPLIDDLKRKDFIAIANLKDADALATSFIGRFAEICGTATPLMKFLTKALEIQF
jgi:uncharacterized protein (TIGR02453 family)